MQHYAGVHLVTIMHYKTVNLAQLRHHRENSDVYCKQFVCWNHSLDDTSSEQNKLEIFFSVSVKLHPLKMWPILFHYHHQLYRRLY